MSDMSIVVQKAAEAFYFSTSTPIQFFKERKSLRIFFPLLLTLFKDNFLNITFLILQ